jgi:hypothetical protein
MSNCKPLDPNAPVNKADSVRSYLSDLLSLDPEKYRGVMIPLGVKLSGVSQLAGSNTYRVPSTHQLVIHEIFGHLAMNAIATEFNADGTAITASKKASAPADVPGLALQKALNCHITLQNSDRSQKVIDNSTGTSLSLASVLPMTGGNAIDFRRAPHIVPAGETLELGVTLADNTAGIIGGETEYGLVLVGTLIRESDS